MSSSYNQQWSFPVRSDLKGEPTHYKKTKQITQTLSSTGREGLIQLVSKGLMTTLTVKCYILNLEQQQKKSYFW